MLFIVQTLVVKLCITEDEPEVNIGPKLEEMTSPPEEPTQSELLTRDESVRLNKPTREWDKGKESKLYIIYTLRG